MENLFNISGLTNEEIIESRKKFGTNILKFKKENDLLSFVIGIIKEPMVILLLLASAIYFISGDVGDGLFLAGAIIFQTSISLYQDNKSRNALEKLKTFSQATCKVIRNNTIEDINSADLVIGDCLILEEGISITADGMIIHSNDFSVNESILTGEFMPVFKNKQSEDKYVYNGTMVTSGLAIVTVNAIGNETKLGKLGKSIEDIKTEKTPLEIQINNFIKAMVLLGAIVFVIVWIINYFNSRNILDSLLKALTLAMSIIPEEIPVAFTTFMALGAYRLMKLGVVVKQIKTVETLGSATVICTDKTGTITENKMSLAKIYALQSDRILGSDSDLNDIEKELLKMSMWASEPHPFDPMEIALHSTYSNIIEKDERPYFKMIHEYPLSGTPPMMTHIFEDETGTRIIAAKGAPEAIMNLTNLSANEKEKIEETIKLLAADGYRMLAVATGACSQDLFPDTQQEIAFSFNGIVAFYDPPKENIQKVFEDFYKAGISIKIVTGDNTATTTAIAKQILFKGHEMSLTGDELMKLSNEELPAKVKNTSIFTRMFPEAKLKIINALKQQGEIVAMTGDGVNDGPALKAAHIGIAMGKKGSEIAKQAASLILVNDDLSKMVDAVAMGRRIYANLKKAIQYIISIHIPIILTVFIPLALGWKYPNIFSPVHIIFLELIMGPTCSIIFENEPMEKNTMLQKPRKFTTTFFNFKELTTSIIQGLAITVGTIGVYLYSVNCGYSESLTRTMVFIVLIFANILLTLINRSFYYSIFTTLKYKNKLIKFIIGITLVITGLLLYIEPLNHFFQFNTINVSQLLLAIGIGFTSVIWYELVKWINRLRKNK